MDGGEKLICPTRGTAGASCWPEGWKKQSYTPHMLDCFHVFTIQNVPAMRKKGQNHWKHCNVLTTFDVNVDDVG